MQGWGVKLHDHTAIARFQHRLGRLQPGRRDGIRASNGHHPARRRYTSATSDQKQRGALREQHAMPFNDARQDRKPSSSRRTIFDGPRAAPGMAPSVGARPSALCRGGLGAFVNLCWHRSPGGRSLMGWLHRKRWRRCREQHPTCRACGRPRPGRAVTVFPDTTSLDVLIDRCQLTHRKIDEHGRMRKTRARRHSRSRTVELGEWNGGGNWGSGASSSEQ